MANWTLFRSVCVMSALRSALWCLPTSSFCGTLQKKTEGQKGEQTWLCPSQDYKCVCNRPMVPLEKCLLAEGRCMTHSSVKCLEMWQTPLQRQVWQVASLIIPSARGSQEGTQMERELYQCASCWTSEQILPWFGDGDPSIFCFSLYTMTAYN